MPNFSQTFLANLDRVGGKQTNASGNSGNISSSSANFSPSFMENVQRIDTTPPPTQTPFKQVSNTNPIAKPVQQPNLLQQTEGAIGGGFKAAQDFINKEIKNLSGVKMTLTPSKPQVQQPQIIQQNKPQQQQQQQPQKKGFTLADGSVMPANTTLSAGKAPSVWDKVVEFFGNITGNSADDQKARAMNAYAVQKVDGETLYQKRVQEVAKSQKLDPKALDKSIQNSAKAQGVSKYDMVGLGLVDLSKQGGSPFKNSPMEDITKELGVRDMPTNKEFTDMLMTAALGFGLVEAPLATIKAVGIFSGVNAIKSGAISALKGHGFNVLSGNSLSDLAPNSPMPVQTALDFIDFLGSAAVTHGIYKVSPKVGEVLTKDVLTKYNVPETVHFSPDQVQRVIKGEELGKMKDDLAKAGLSSSEWKAAATKGIQIELPTEKVVQLVDKPYWKTLKGLIGMQEAAPQTTIVKEGKKITNIAGYLPSGEYTPQELMGKVINTPLADTPEGKSIIKAGIQAQESGANIKIEVPETNQVVTKDTLAKEEAQKLVRLKEPGQYKSALDQQTTEALHSEPIKYRDEYIQQYGNVVNPDLARKLASEYNGINAKDVNNFGVGVKNIVLKHLLDTGKQRTDSNNTVLWTGGSPGSGKSTTLDHMTPEEKGKYIAIIDTTLSPNSTVKDIKKVLNSGYNVQIKFTVSDPFEAWKRVLARAMNEKSIDYQRVVSEEYFIKAVEDSKKNALEAYDKFHTNPKFEISFINNTSTPDKMQEAGIDFVRNFQYNTGELRRKIYEYTQQAHEQGKISEELFKEFTSDRQQAVDTGNAESSKASPASSDLTLEPSKATTLEESQKEKIAAGFNPESVRVGNLKTIPRPSITKSDLKTLLRNSAEFKANPVLIVDAKKDLTFDGKKIHFKISADALGLNGDNLKEGDKITVNEKTLTGTAQQMRVIRNGKVFASTGTSPLGNFEKVGEGSSKTEFKLFEQTKELVRKYAQRIGEGYTPRRALGSFHTESKNIRTTGINDFATNTHEIAHAIDERYTLSMQIAKKVGETKKGMPLYEKATRGLRKEMTALYKKYYPGGSAQDPVKTRMIEGYATLVQKYIEMPTTISAEFPNIYRAFLTREGKYFNAMTDSFIADAQGVVASYQGLEALDKVGARVVNKTLETDKTFLNFFEKVRTFMEDELYPVEKVGKIAGKAWSGDDPSLWLRQYSRGGGIYANNILSSKNGFWTLDSNGDFAKKLDFNWKNLIDTLAKAKTTDSFGYYLVARDQVFEWKELDTLKDKFLEVMKTVEEVGKEEAATMTGEDGKTLLEEALDAKKAYLEQKQYLDANGFTRAEVEQAYTENNSRFIEEEKMYDQLVREDLNMLHNPQVGIVNGEKYDRLTAKQGYASMKRVFFDDILGEAKAQYQGAGGKLAPKISSLKRRTGGQQQIINPVLNGMVNHVEVVKKSLKQIVYNKIGKIAVEGKAPELFQVVEVRSFKDDTGAITFPQEKDENIVMARLGYTRVPVLTDKLIKNTIDSALTFQSMNIFEHLLVTAGRVFTIGTTGAYAPFALVNFPADQWNAILNTRNNYTPLMDQIKLLGKVITGKGGKASRYWHEWEIMGGDKMTLFQAQMQSTDEAIKYISQEKNGIEKVLDLVNKGVDIGSMPAKYSETVTRFSEYVKARQAGKAQVVALEEAGRITAPFHHIGSWRIGDKASAKFIIKSIPFGNASLQVVAQAIRTAETPAGRRRLYFVMLAMTAAYLSSMYMVSQYGSQDQKEQYKDLGVNDIGQYLFYPNIGGSGLTRVRVSQELSTIGTVINMILAHNILGAQFTKEDYKDALTTWIPRQLDIASPTEMFFSWFNPLFKVPVEVIANFKDYPRVSPIENQSMQNLEPKDRFNEYTSALAKQLGKTFDLSPIKIDYLINGLFGRASSFITGKPNIYNPTSQVNRDYLFTLGKRVDNFYTNSAKLDQEYASLRAKWKDQPTVPEDVINQVTTLKQKREAYDYTAKLIKFYREIPDTNKEAQKSARSKIIPILEKLPAP